MADVVLSAVPTPFATDGSLDLAGARRLFGFAADHVDGLFVAGTTGEFPALDDDERLSLVELALEVAGADRVIAHIGAPDSYRAARLARSAVSANSAICGRCGTYAVGARKSKYSSYKPSPSDLNCARVKSSAGWAGTSCASTTESASTLSRRCSGKTLN